MMTLQHNWQRTNLHFLGIVDSRLEKYCDDLATISVVEKQCKLSKHRLKLINVHHFKSIEKQTVKLTELNNKHLCLLFSSVSFTVNRKTDSKTNRTKQQTQMFQFKMCVCVCMRACVCAYVRKKERMCVYACMYASLHASVCVHLNLIYWYINLTKYLSKRLKDDIKLILYSYTHLKKTHKI